MQFEHFPLESFCLTCRHCTVQKVVLHYCELCQQKCGWQKRGLEGTQTRLMSWGSPCLCRRLDIWDPGGGAQAGKEMPLWRWRASRGPAGAVRCRGPKEIPLWRWCAVTGRWKGYKLESRLEGRKVVWKYTFEAHTHTHIHISSKGKSRTAKTHFLTSICIGPLRSKS